MTLQIEFIKRRIAYKIMTPERQKKIDRIKHISGAGLIISLGLMIIFPLMGIWHFDIPKEIYSIITKVILTLFFLSFAVFIITSFWATDKEREQKKADMKEILQEIKEDEKVERKQKKTEYNDAKCPLIDLTPAQIGVVQDIIKKIPVGRYIGNAELMALFRALQADGYLPKRKDLDLDTIIDWVNSFMSPAEVDAVHFRSEFYIRPKDNKITKMGNKVRQGFDKL